MEKPKEETYFLDKNKQPIYVGSKVRVVTNFNTTIHGIYVDYLICKTAGGYLFSYLCSEKGQVLPPGYTGGYMKDCIPEEAHLGHDTLIFSPGRKQVPQWEVLEA